MHAHFCDLTGMQQGLKIRGGQVVLGGDNVSPLVEIGLIDPPKSGGAAAPPASHLAACLYLDPLGAIVCLDSL